MIEVAFYVVVHICDGGLDLYIIFTAIHIVHIVREVKVSCKIVHRSLRFVSFIIIIPISFPEYGPSIAITLLYYLVG